MPSRRRARTSSVAQNHAWSFHGFEADRDCILGLCALAGVVAFALAFLTLISAYLPTTDVSDRVQIGGGKGVGTQGRDAHP